MQQPRSKRTKRDSAGNLYRHCRLGGDCLPDVVNKYENKTPADNILKWGSTGIFLGGLGIGTGRGTGGSTGYRPLGGDLPAAGRPAVPRPAVPVDIGPVDVGGFDGTVTAEAPSVVPLLEGSDITVGSDVVGGDSTISSGGGGRNVVVHEVLVHPPPGNPVIASAAEDSEAVAVLEVGGGGSGTQGQINTVQSTSQHSNPAFNSVLHSTPTPGEASVARSVVVSHDSFGTLVHHEGTFEEIPLESLGPSEFEIEEGGPRSSTPLQSVLKRARQLYHRTVKQTPVSNPQFLKRPSSLVVFENPAFEFDPETTLQFDVDPDYPRAAPDPDFRDIKSLGRVHYGTAPGGRVRVSRLGNTATMKLRSGTHTGGRSHFFFDVSSIPADPSTFEMSTFGEHSGEHAIILDSSDSAVIESGFEGDLSFPEEEQLLDEYSEDFSHGHLSLATGRGRTRTVVYPTSTKHSLKAYVTIGDISDAVVVAHPGWDDTTDSTIPFSPLSPTVDLSDFELSMTFDLHPSLLRKRRKRKRTFL
ncbi:putative L2 protein [Canis familiaris papillomavirus 13]|uniref:Minor capsid protein L2 n=1 Tax=Canis familiaris papillomavirus 13 TaxID=1226723 RepID=J7JMM7_9PAPI|nr:putative L2 protein [Canis familiaris papillomavirus 13]AFQ52500.1 putative L2 protein [Canis familiaris papillomavirus 13]